MSNVQSARRRWQRVENHHQGQKVNSLRGELNHLNLADIEIKGKIKPMIMMMGEVNPPSQGGLKEECQLMIVRTQIS